MYKSRISVAILFILIGIVLFSASCNKYPSDLPDDITSTYKMNRSAVVNNYFDKYNESRITNCGWTGDIASCDAGSLPQSTHDKVIMRINYFRELVGLNSNTTLDTTKFTMYQEAALIMDANNQLSHTPTNDWSCWSQEG